MLVLVLRVLVVLVYWCWVCSCWWCIVVLLGVGCAVVCGAVCVGVGVMSM